MDSTTHGVGRLNLQLLETNDDEADCAATAPAETPALPFRQR